MKIEYIDHNIALRKGDFIIVRYESNKRNLMYIGQVEKKQLSIDSSKLKKKKNKYRWF